ncbi:MAG: FKBP-type peptidyl-prolyl cis-trans isomerase [Candidatus Micrarchaeota archaeon]|nr:FKBP-type peptidyl-prolyl cis-trans isomerase [Candidatus Micrarchaeota archaeon]MDE1833543.1 FKBP-type peptidyl-prolyl cis-trans isomerase [Candidatus Micrarchaeota archaeon]
MEVSSTIALTTQECTLPAPHEKENSYGPVLVVLGSKGVIKGLDRELHSMGINESKKATFKPDEAFGERMEDLVRIMPIAEFRKHDIDPYPGLQVNLDNMTAIVKSVNSGRVVVDANHPLAGREITYEVKVVKNLTDDKEKISALGKMTGLDVTKIDVKDKDVRLSFDNSVKKNADYFMGKANLVAGIFTYFKNVGKVDIDEEYVRPEEAKQKS